MSEPSSAIISLLAVSVIVGILTVVLLYRKKKRVRQEWTDYRAFFILGICLTPLGIVLVAAIHVGFIGIMGIGVTYLAIGLVNRRRWKAS